jgi:hypothetical protein
VVGDVAQSHAQGCSLMIPPDNQSSPNHPHPPSEEALALQLQQHKEREVKLHQELGEVKERHASEVVRLRRKVAEAEAACQDARRQVAALRLSSKGLTLDQAETILHGEEVRRQGSGGGAWLLLIKQLEEALDTPIQPHPHRAPLPPIPRRAWWRRSW